jgi:lysine 6-dehydrogenase
MNVAVLGSGMIGKAITFDLLKNSNFDKIAIVDYNKNSLLSAKNFLQGEKLNFIQMNINKSSEINSIFKNFDLAISAIPYLYNFKLAKKAVKFKTHFLDLGGNNNIVENERKLFKKAKEQKITIIPDCGLAPGLVSIITRDIVETLDYVNFVKIRVGGLPLKPKPPLNYQIVFSLDGLINEYVEDSMVLDHGRIVKMKSMTNVEKIIFPNPFGELEAFLTSGGCSTLPYTYRNEIDYLDYKTIRYPGHCEKFKFLLDIGFGSEDSIRIMEHDIIPRKFLIQLLKKKLPKIGRDVVLLKIFSKGLKDNKKINLEFTMIDYYDDNNRITAMMRTTGFSVSIIAQMIENGLLYKHGVFCPEEIIPPSNFYQELNKRNIKIKREVLNK